MAEPHARWSEGLRVGRFELLRELARGGMAELWVAQERGGEGASQPVVIKRMLSRDDDVNMLLDEARLLSQLNHPNIVRVFGLEELEGSPVILMELLTGITLEELNELSKRVGRIPAALAVHIAARVAAALGHAHRKAGPRGEPLQIVHRDVSPANIMITTQGTVKLLDFGIARARNRSTRTVTGYIKGKRAYMSPEQSAGGELDGRSDVFSLGLVLWELLSGEGVYAAKNEEGIANLLAGTEKYPAIHERNPAVPRSLEMLVEEAMSLDPRARPGDGVGFAERLEFWLGLLPTRPHESDLVQYVSGLQAGGSPPAVEVTEQRTAPVPPRPAQATPSSPRVRAAPPSAWLLTVAALVLFGASVGVGWAVSRAVWGSPAELAGPAAAAP